jgi:adenylosuccinate lyase
VIDRYTRPEMGLLWDADQRFAKMMQVEITVAEVQASLNIIPKAAAAAIRKKSRYLPKSHFRRSRSQVLDASFQPCILS